MPSADITVIPTGGSTAIDLADLAATVKALPSPQLVINNSAYEGGGTFYVNVVKQTGFLESFTLTIDSSPVTTGTATSNITDGWWGYSCTSVPTSTGTHTFKVVTSITALTATATYTI